MTRSTWFDITNPARRREPNYKIRSDGDDGYYVYDKSKLAGPFDYVPRANWLFHGPINECNLWIKGKLKL